MHDTTLDVLWTSVRQAKRRTYGPEVRAVAVWIDEDSGSTFTWPQATTDNRRSRVRGRIRRFGMAMPKHESHLVVVPVVDGVVPDACSPGDDLSWCEIHDAQWHWASDECDAVEVAR